LSQNSKRRILVDKKVIALDVKQDSVCIRCSDGTEIEGSIIIGADGVQSTVRECTKELARMSPDGEAFSRNEAFQTTYRVMFGNSPRLGDVKPGTLYECHRSGTSTQLFVGADRMWFFVYEQLDKPTTERKSYTQKDADEYAARYADHRLTKNLQFGDVYKERNGSGLTNLEEGILSQWSWNRIVLVGDAAHKLTPNLGWGFNSGVHDLVALANGIRNLQNKGSDLDDNESIKTLFSQYQNDRMETLKKVADISSDATRLSTWHTWFKMILDYYLMPLFNLELALSKYVLAPLVANIPILGWLREPHYRTGTVPWKYIPNDSLPE
jgi:2-polyprenyl-6-methoxyphenol hydroxylase-like FAD-dependent oxidoreductase